jgi:hypothetical protein
MYLLITASSVSTDGALRRGISAITPEDTGSEGAPNATSFGRIRTVAGLQIVHRTSASTQIYTRTHRTRHHRTRRRSSHISNLTCSIRIRRSPSNRPPAHSDRTDSSSLPASLRPAAPPACRPNCPGRLAWTRRLLGRTAQRLHTVKPCHAGSHGTLRKYFEKNSNKKTAILDATKPPRSLAGMPEHPHHAWHQLCSAASERPPGRLQERLHGRLQASSVQQQIAPPLARAGCRTAIRGFHA